MATAMIVPLICYSFITYYAFVGSKSRALAAARVTANS
jgi:fucose permease